MAGAAISACKKANNLKNTANVCKAIMGPSAMFFLIPPGVTWTKTQLATFVTYVKTQVHAPRATRWFPIFGPSAPIRRITLNKTADVIFTADDNTQIFINYGVLNRAFGTTEVGLCYAKALMSFLKSGYTLLEVDISDQIMHRENSDGSFGGLVTTFMYSPSPDTADFKNPAFVNFQISIDPKEYVQNGTIFQMDDSSILDIVGLEDVDVTDATGSTTTKLKIGIQVDCTGDDLLATSSTLATALAAVGNFVVKNKATQAVMTITAAAVVSGHIELTGTFVSGQIYTVSGAGSDVWYAANISGFDPIGSVDITIP